VAYLLSPERLNTWVPTAEVAERCMPRGDTYSSNAFDALVSRIRSRVGDGALLRRAGLIQLAMKDPESIAEKTLSLLEHTHEDADEILAGIHQVVGEVQGVGEIRSDVDEVLQSVKALVGEIVGGSLSDVHKDAIVKAVFQGGYLVRNVECDYCNKTRQLALRCREPGVVDDGKGHITADVEKTICTKCRTEKFAIGELIRNNGVVGYEIVLDFVKSKLSDRKAADQAIHAITSAEHVVETALRPKRKK
jgi:hypothetical protein